MVHHMCASCFVLAMVFCGPQIQAFLLKRLHDNVQFSMVSKVMSGVLRSAQTLVSWSLRNFRGEKNGADEEN
jgi:hypothetical protein